MSTEDLDRETGTAVTDSEEQPGAEPKRRLEMEVEVTSVGPCKKHVKVSIPREEIERQYTDSLENLSKDAVVPGFRPGRAPRQLVIKRFRKQVSEQVKSALLVTALEQLDNEYELEPISPPQLDIAAIELPDTGPMKFEIEVEVRPEFELPDYHGLTLKRPVHSISESDVEAGLQQYLERSGQVVPKLEGAAELGDFLTADLVFYRPDGSVLTEAKEIEFRLQKEMRFRDGAIPEIGAALVGARPGETRRTQAKLGSSAGEAALRGATIPVEIRLHDLKQMRLPEITPAFLGSIGFSGIDDLRHAVRDALRRRVYGLQRQSLRRQILDQLLEKTPFELPGELVAREEKNTVARLALELRQQGLSDNEIRANEAAIRANAREITLRSLKELILLAKIAEAEKIAIEDADYAEEIASMAERTGESPRRIRARLEKEGLNEQVTTQILERKVIERIIQLATVEDDLAAVVEPEASVETLDHAASGEAEETEPEEGAEAGADDTSEPQAHTAGAAES